MKALCRHRRTRRHDMQLFIRPVRRHLPPAARHILRRAHRLHHLLFHGISQRQAKCAISVVWKEPVISRPQRHPRRHQQRLMPRARDLEKYLLLPLQHNLAIVRPPRKIHQPVELHQLFPRHPTPRTRLGDSRNRRRAARAHRAQHRRLNLSSPALTASLIATSHTHPPVTTWPNQDSTPTEDSSSGSMSLLPLSTRTTRTTPWTLGNICHASATALRQSYPSQYNTLR